MKALRSLYEPEMLKILLVIWLGLPKYVIYRRWRNASCTHSFDHCWNISIITSVHKVSKMGVKSSDIITFMVAADCWNLDEIIPDDEAVFVLTHVEAMSKPYQYLRSACVLNINNLTYYFASLSSESLYRKMKATKWHQTLDYGATWNADDDDGSLLYFYRHVKWASQSHRYWDMWKWNNAAASPGHSLTRCWGVSLDIAVCFRPSYQSLYMKQNVKPW